MTLRLKIYPSEFLGMIRFLQGFTPNLQVPLSQQSLACVVLTHYLASLKIERILAWKYLPTSKLHALSLPLPVARALYQEMQETYIDDWQAMFLTKLDQAITNHHNRIDPPFQMLKP